VKSIINCYVNWVNLIYKYLPSGSRGGWSCVGVVLTKSVITQHKITLSRGSCLFICLCSPICPTRPLLLRQKSILGTASGSLLHFWCSTNCTLLRQHPSCIFILCLLIVLRYETRLVSRDQEETTIIISETQLNYKTSKIHTILVK
jgi:acyl-ACP thioesterase